MTSERLQLLEQSIAAMSDTLARLVAATNGGDGGGGDGGGGGGGGVGRGNPLVEFIRTMFVQDPGDAGDGLARRIDRDVVDEAFNPE